MHKLGMLLLTLTISTLFIYVPNTGSIGFILNPEVKLTYNQYFWAMGEHLVLITLSLIIWDDAQEYKDLILLFVYIQVLDLVGFVLAYDDPLRDYIITWNILKTVAFGAAIAWKCRK